MNAHPNISLQMSKKVSSSNLDGKFIKQTRISAIFLFLKIQKYSHSRPQSQRLLRPSRNASCLTKNIQFGSVHPSLVLAIGTHRRHKITNTVATFIYDARTKPTKTIWNLRGLHRLAKNNYSKRLNKLTTKLHMLPSLYIYLQTLHFSWQSYQYNARGKISFWCSVFQPNPLASFEFYGGDSVRVMSLLNFCKCPAEYLFHPIFHHPRPV